MFGIEAFVILSVASFNLAVMSWRVCPYLFMYYPVCIQHFLEHCRGQFPALIVSEIFRKFLPVIRLDTVNRVLEERYRVFNKDCRRVTAVILKSLQIALPGILVYCGKLKQSHSLSHGFGTLKRNIFAIHLDPLPRILHLFIFFRHIDVFFLFLMFIIAQLLHNSIQRCYAPGISSFLQFYPKHRQALIGIAAAHIFYEQYFGILMRIRVGMRLA